MQKEHELALAGQMPRYRVRTQQILVNVMAVRQSCTLSRVGFGLKGGEAYRQLRYLQ